MNDTAPAYKGDRFPREIISYAAWLYHRFSLSFRDVEDLLAQRGVVVSYEAICRWCDKFGPGYAARLKRRRGRLGGIWHLDEVFVTIRGHRHYLWRAVDQDGDLIDILVQPRRNRRAAEKFFRKVLKSQGCEPMRLVTDKLRSYAAAPGPSCRRSFTTRRSTRTTEQRSHTSRRGVGSGKCNGSSRPRMCSEFW